VAIQVDDRGKAIAVAGDPDDDGVAITSGDGELERPPAAHRVRPGRPRHGGGPHADGFDGAALGEVTAPLLSPVRHGGAPGGGELLFEHGFVEHDVVLPDDGG
jgi:hypothetical protein